MMEGEKLLFLHDPALMWLIQSAEDPWGCFQDAMTTLLGRVALVLPGHVVCVQDEGSVRLWLPLTLQGSSLSSGEAAQAQVGSAQTELQGPCAGCALRRD